MIELTEKRLSAKKEEMPRLKGFKILYSVCTVA